MKILQKVLMLIAAGLLAASCFGAKTTDSSAYNGIYPQRELYGKDKQYSRNSEAKEGIELISLSKKSDSNKNKALVAYFSCTGNTQSAAKTLASVTGAQLYAITPKKPYTSDDLNYNNKDSRANAEIKDTDARPEIAEEVADFSHYNVIYIGYPIWWGDLPPIMRTFLESYDFSGKTIMPFCTSGGSGIATSVATIKTFAPKADVRNGLRATARSGKAEFKRWIANEGIKIQK